MSSIKWKGVAETVGITAIVASLIFVGLQMRQSQEIAIAETYMSILSSEIEVNNAINENADLWAKANSGAELSDAESVVFDNLVRNMNSEANRSMNQLRRLGHTSAAEAQTHNFASFLYQNPAARKIWTVQQGIWIRHSEVLQDFASNWPINVEADLEKLDQMED